jgi:hypothetical protein
VEVPCPQMDAQTLPVGNHGPHTLYKKHYGKPPFVAYSNYKGGIMVDAGVVQCLSFLYLMNYGLEIFKKRNSWIRAFDVSFIQTIGVLIYYFVFKVN